MRGRSAIHQLRPLPDDDWMRWLPPEPHRGAILEFLSRARATLIPRGEDEAPLVQFEDGGAMELDQIRYDPQIAFYHAADPQRRTRGEYRATQYSDVCGTMDELNRVFAEEPDRIADDPEYLLALLEDALYMIRRMDARQQRYFEFAGQLAALAEKAQAVEEQSAAPAEAGAGALRDVLKADPGGARAQLDRLNELAEQIRDVANRQEARLRDHKAAAIRVFEAYQAIKGRRDWGEEEVGSD